MAHLGLRSHWVGEVTTPPIGPGDVLLLGSGGGRTSCLVSHAETAAKARPRFFSGFLFRVSAFALRA